MERDVQNFAPRAYAQSVPVVAGDQHRVLLSSLESHLSGKDAPTLVVLGCGGEVLPYSFRYQDGMLGGSNIDRVRGMIRHGNLILVDVSDNAESGLRRSQETLTHCGFFREDRFRCCRAGGNSFVPDGKVQGDACGPSTVMFLQQNLRDPLLIADESADAIDANLTLHHVTQTRECLQRMYGELYRALKPGGLLHLGEGHVDMNYSEHKICRIGADMAEILGHEVVVLDERDPQYPYCYRVGPGRTDSLLHVSPRLQEAEIRLSAEGTVHLWPRVSTATSGAASANQRLLNELGRRGYRQVLRLADQVLLPLIDPLMEIDQKNLIEKVDRYYDAIIERCRTGCAGTRDGLVRETEKAVNIERGHAARGIVEYYMGQALILDALAKAGFENVRVVRQSEPLYNILAKKPPP